MTQSQKYLQRSARCYLDAGLLDDACRCFEQLDDALQAARLHKSQGRWTQAADWYERIARWEGAAHCYERAGQGEAAARCWFQHGDRLQAAWALAEQARRFASANDVLRGFEPANACERLGLDLVLARCQAGIGEQPAAAQCLRDVSTRLPAFGPAALRQRLEAWAVRLAAVLQRPDLAALVYAAAVTAGIPGATERWTQWAQAALGDTTGIPSAAT